MTILKCQRKRGDDLVAAIHAAVFEELVGNGIERFSFESVAQRAGTGKASIYRRWSSREELIISAFQARSQANAQAQTPQFTSLRDELLFMFGNTATQLNTDFGIAVREIVAELHRHTGFAELVRDYIIKDRNQRIATAIDNAVSRGELPRTDITQAQIELGPALITHHFFIYGTAPDATYIKHIVDDLLLPTLINHKVSV